MLLGNLLSGSRDVFRQSIEHHKSTRSRFYLATNQFGFCITVVPCCHCHTRTVSRCRQCCHASQSVYFPDVAVNAVAVRACRRFKLNLLLTTICWGSF